MKNLVRNILLLTVAASNFGCASVKSHSTTVAAVAASRANLSGRWDFRVVLGERSTPGELWLFGRGGQYTGTLTPAGTNTLPVRSLILRQTTIAMTIDTPDGPVTFAGVVNDAGTTMQGIVTYHQGQRYPLEAKRRQATDH
jgi:hypothetical protein